MKFNNKSIDIKILGIYLSGLIILLTFSWLWWNNVHNNPKNVFEGMLKNSLQLKGLTRSVHQEGVGQTLDQKIALNLTPSSFALSKTAIHQEGAVTADVTTESIGTPQNDYVRYTFIETSQKKDNGEPLDFSSILNIWGGSESSDSTTDGELFNESVFGIVPFANLTPRERDEILNLMIANNIYEVDYEALKKETKDGRPTIVYEVEVDPSNYVVMLKRLAELTNLNNLGHLNPSDYAGADKVRFVLEVDVWSRQLTRVVYGNGEREEHISSHNIVRGVAIPKDSISIEELQDRLQKIR